MYDATVGKFLSEDPLGFDADDPNLVRYVGNSPTNFVDPSGNIKIKVGDSSYDFTILKEGGVWKITVFDKYGNGVGYFSFSLANEKAGAGAILVYKPFRYSKDDVIELIQVVRTYRPGQRGGWVPVAPDWKWDFEKGISIAQGKYQHWVVDTYSHERHTLCWDETESKWEWTNENRIVQNRKGRMIGGRWVDATLVDFPSTNEEMIMEFYTYAYNRTTKTWLHGVHWIILFKKGGKDIYYAQPSIETTLSPEFLEAIKQFLKVFPNENTPYVLP